MYQFVYVPCGVNDIHTKMAQYVMLEIVVHPLML